MRKALNAALLAVAIACAGYGVAVWRNNAATEPVDAATLERSLARAIAWLDARHARLLEHNNPSLWWMLSEASTGADSAALTAIVDRYRERWIDPDPIALWRPVFDPDVYVGQPVLGDYPDAEPYQLLFVYGLTCDAEFGRRRIIRRQLEPGFCGLAALSPRCATHQLVGVRLMQRTGCGDAGEIGALADALETRIEREVTWDPRVGDAYLQRVLLLAESAGVERVKPAWVARVVAAQNEDGGWDDLDPLLPLPGARYLGLSSSSVVVRRERSTFHATAQAVWLLSLLVSETAASE